METLQKLLPLLQDLWPRWYQLTLDNADYAAVLVVSAWLLTAIFYSIRLGFAKRQIARITAAGNAIQANLNTAQEQLQTLQQQLNETTEQMQTAVQKAESESERANTLEQRLQASNQKLADSSAHLVERFELNLQTLPAANADNLLAEYDAIIARIGERFQNEQQAKTQLQLTLHTEAAKVAEKEMLVSSLQNRLDTQTQQLAKLEMAVEQYEAAQRQLEADKERQLAEAMARQQAEAARLAALETQRQAEKHTPPPPPVEKPVLEPVKQPEIVEQIVQEAPLIVEAPAKPEPVVSQAPVSEKPVEKAPTPPADTKKPKAAEPSKGKGFFGRTIEKFAKMDEKLGFQAKAEAQAEEVPVVEAAKEVEAPQVESPQPQATAPSQEQKESAGIGKKMGGLLGGFKKSQSAAAVEKPQETVAAPEPVAESNPIEGDKKPAKSTGKITGLFGKFKAKK